MNIYIIFTLIYMFTPSQCSYLDFNDSIPEIGLEASDAG